MVNKHRNHFTRKETEYLIRNAGKVPAAVMAQLLKRTVESVRGHASRHGISLRIPGKLVKEHWSKYDRRTKAAKA